MLMGRKGAGHRAYLTRMRNLRVHKRKKPKSKGHVIGFYKDHGKTKPITKSDAQLKQKKVVKSGRQFKGVKPLARETSWTINLAKNVEGKHLVVPTECLTIRKGNSNDIKRANIIFGEVVSQEKDDRKTTRVFMQDDHNGAIVRDRRLRPGSPPLSVLADQARERPNSSKRASTAGRVITDRTEIRRQLKARAGINRKLDDLEWQLEMTAKYGSNKKKWPKKPKNWEGNPD